MKRRVPSIILALVAIRVLERHGGAQVAANRHPAAALPLRAAAVPPKRRHSGCGIRSSRPSLRGTKKSLLIANVFVALAGLAYALMLVKQVRRRREGTPRMQEIAPGRPRRGQRLSLPAVPRRRRADRRHDRGLLYFAAQSTGTPRKSAIGRAVAFFLGSIFSATVGFVGMRLAHHRKPARGSRRPGTASARPCSSVTAPERSPAC